VARGAIREAGGGGGILDVPYSCLLVAPWLVIKIYCDTELYQRRHVHKLIWGRSTFTYILQIDPNPYSICGKPELKMASIFEKYVSEL
jgi:hypothetical protein